MQKDKLLRVLAILLLVIAIVIIFWQGMRWVRTDDQVSPQRIQLATTISTTYTTSTIQTETFTITHTTAKQTTTTDKTTKKSTARTTKSQTTQTETVQEETVVQFPLELNYASSDELMAIPGIGEVLAYRIIAYREANGGFMNLEQLMEVDGIGESKYASIAGYLYLTTEYYTETIPLMEENGNTVQAQQSSADSQTQPVQQNAEPMEQETEPSVYDLNLVTKEELLTIPNVDEELADKILELRDTIQYFSNSLELLYIDGMTTAKYEQIEPYFTIDVSNIPSK